MNRTEVRISAGLIRRKRELLAGSKHFGLECRAVVDHGMGMSSPLCPGDLRPGLHRDRRRREAEVIDLDLGHSSGGHSRWGRLKTNQGSSSTLLNKKSSQSFAGYSYSSPSSSISLLYLEVRAHDHRRLTLQNFPAGVSTD